MKTHYLIATAKQGYLLACGRTQLSEHGRNRSKPRVTTHIRNTTCNMCTRTLKTDAPIRTVIRWPQ